MIGSVPVHRIVATAFHGEPTAKEYIVDHIDTNRQNNRQENLRWVTRLENLLLNPITAKRIVIAYGSVEAFLADTAKFPERFCEPNLQWMRTVTMQEAKSCLERMLAWAKSDKLPSGGSLDEWIFNRKIIQYQNVDTKPEVPSIIVSKTLNAEQRNWKIPSEFPCCPQEYAEEPILTYFKKLESGAVFCRNNVYSSSVLKSSISDDHQSIHVISKSIENEALKPWALAEITYENRFFIHTSLGSFITLEGAEKHYCLAQGLEWSGGDSIDDYC